MADAEMHSIYNKYFFLVCFGTCHEHSTFNDADNNLVFSFFVSSPCLGKSYARHLKTGDEMPRMDH